jgi:ATP-dependent Clp protease ATP-binding subunit ClpB
VVLLVPVGEPDIEASISILRGLKDRYETHHRVRILDTALVDAVRLSHRYISSRKLPDKAIDLMDEACSDVRVNLDSRPQALDEVRLGSINRLLPSAGTRSLM